MNWVGKKGCQPVLVASMEVVWVGWVKSWGSEAGLEGILAGPRACLCCRSRELRVVPAALQALITETTCPTRRLSLQTTPGPSRTLTRTRPRGRPPPGQAGTQPRGTITLLIRFCIGWLTPFISLLTSLPLPALLWYHSPM